MIPAPNLDLGAVVPLALLSAGAFLVLVGEIALTGRRSVLGRPVTNEWIGSLLAGLSVLVLAAVAAVSFRGFLGGSELVFNLDHPMMRLDPFANFTTAVLALAALLSCLISVTYLSELRIHHGEYYALLLLSVAGCMGIDIRMILGRRQHAGNHAALIGHAHALVQAEGLDIHCIRCHWHPL